MHLSAKIDETLARLADGKTNLLSPKVHAALEHVADLAAKVETPITAGELSARMDRVLDRLDQEVPVLPIAAQEALEQAADALAQLDVPGVAATPVPEAVAPMAPVVDPMVQQAVPPEQAIVQQPAPPPAPAPVAVPVAEPPPVAEPVEPSEEEIANAPPMPPPADVTAW